MKLLAGLFFLLPFVQASAQGFPYNSNEYIEWSDHKNLTWNEFQGVVEDDVFGDAGTAVKIQALPYYLGKELHYHVYALFSKNKSWCKEKSTELLAHEQLHFDIAELTARQVRQEIMRLKNLGVNDPGLINNAIEHILAESNEFDALYDYETVHGLLEDKQKSWNKLVPAKLNALEAFKKENHYW